MISPETDPKIPYVPQQIILFGHPQRIDALLETSQAAQSGPQEQGDTPPPAPPVLLSRSTFAVSSATAAETEMLANLPDPELRELRLYRTDTPQALQNQPGFEDVIVELNYLIRGIPWTAGGSPWTAGGSPWTAGGSPWTAGGSPWLNQAGTGGASIRQQAETAFAEQWAWGADGINAQDLLTPRQPGAEDGENVWVGIFDTSPFAVPMTSISVDMPPAPLTLALSHPIPGGVPHGCGGGLGNHGFFVAGLIHALAPAAQLQLIRVLDDAAQGTLFTLVTALYQFMAALPAGQRAVINMSLGLHGSDEADAADWDGPDLLRDALWRAYEQNIITIAAAGNESSAESAPLPAAYPARWDFVIGVAASNRQQSRACFSNQGDLLAPGGDGDHRCLPNLGRCKDGDCPYALISLDVASYTGYSYGVGTSFAAPLVAGLAARAQAGVGAQNASAGAEHVRQIILNSANANGVVDAQAL